MCAVWTGLLPVRIVSPGRHWVMRQKRLVSRSDEYEAHPCVSAHEFRQKGRGYLFLKKLGFKC